MDTVWDDVQSQCTSFCRRHTRIACLHETRWYENGPHYYCIFENTSIAAMGLPPALVCFLRCPQRVNSNLYSIYRVYTFRCYCAIQSFPIYTCYYYTNHWDFIRRVIMNASAMPDARDVNYDMLLSCVPSPPLISHGFALKVTDPARILGPCTYTDEYYPTWISMVP